MGLFSRRREPEWQPPTRPHCSCTRHLDDELRQTLVPVGSGIDGTDGLAATSIEDLLSPAGLSVEVVPPDERRLDDSSAPFHWNVGVYDDARMHYDDGAELELDAALAAQPGVDEVAWMDREIFYVSAPTLCADGVLAAAAVALADDRVRRAGG